MTRLLVLALLALVCSAPLSAQHRGLAKVTILVRVQYQDFDEQKPWEKLEPGSREVTGVVVAGPRILVADQAVRSATDIAVYKDDGSWAEAQIAHQDPDINLALLSVDAEQFLSSFRPARIGKRVPKQGLVQAPSWQNREIDVSEHHSYGVQVRNSRENIARGFFVVDAVQNTWSQPLFLGFFTQLVGIAVTGDDDHSWAVPAETIARYLAMVDEKPYAGFSGFDPYWQYNSHPAQARALGSTATGIVLTKLPFGGTLETGLQAGDVLLSLDGNQIDSDGFFEHDDYGRVQFHAIADSLPVGQKVKASIVRGGKPLEVEVEMKHWLGRDQLIPWRRSEEAPPYVVRGGLVFRELDGDYLRSFGESWRYAAPPFLAALTDFENLEQTAERKRVIVLASVLPDAFNIGYHDLVPHPVSTVNGESIDSLQELTAAFEQPQGAFHTIRLTPGGTRELIVLDAERFAGAHERILTNYSIARSERLPR